MPTVQIYSIKEQKLVDFNVTADVNNEIIAAREDEFYKFPGGLTKSKFLKLVAETSKANEKVVPLEEDVVAEQQEVIDANDKLLDSLDDDSSDE